MINAYRVKIAPNPDDPLHRVLERVGSQPQVLYRHPGSVKGENDDVIEETVFDFEITKHKSPKVNKNLEGFCLQEHISLKNTVAAFRMSSNNNNDASACKTRNINKKVRK